MTPRLRAVAVDIRHRHDTSRSATDDTSETSSRKSDDRLQRRVEVDWLILAGRTSAGWRDRLLTRASRSRMRRYGSRHPEPDPGDQNEDGQRGWRSLAAQVMHKLANGASIENAASQSFSCQCRSGSICCGMTQLCSRATRDRPYGKPARSMGQIGRRRGVGAAKRSMDAASSHRRRVAIERAAAADPVLPARIWRARASC